MFVLIQYFIREIILNSCYLFCTSRIPQLLIQWRLAAFSRKVGTWWSFRSLPTQDILWLYVIILQTCTGHLKAWAKVIPSRVLREESKGLWNLAVLKGRKLPKSLLWQDETRSFFHPLSGAAALGMHLKIEQSMAHSYLSTKKKVEWTQQFSPVSGFLSDLFLQECLGVFFSKCRAANLRFPHASLMKTYKLVNVFLSLYNQLMH